MKPGRKQKRLMLVPFATRPPEATYSTAVIRVSRCNQCGAIRVWPYVEHVLDGDQIVETIEHPGHPATHEPGCPQAQNSLP